MKCLVMIRVSTTAQQLEDQHREMVEFCNQEGWTDLIFVEDKGASAIKLNDSYRLMIDQVKESITNDSDIKCMAVWELSRAFRNEGVYYEVKTFLVSHGVQFICKNPYLKLLNPDGTVNQGMEVAMSLLATLSKQEMEIKIDRFTRAKKGMKAKGMYSGGPIIKYGYRVENKFIVPDPITAPIVKEVFELYATGKYSTYSLTQELKERGRDVTYSLINRMTADTTYIGYKEDRIYPPLVSQELWDKCKEIRERNTLSIPKGKKYVFGSGIFKCPECGSNMIAEGSQFRCWHHNKCYPNNHLRCSSDITIRVCHMDGLLWWIAQKEHAKYLMTLNDDKEKEYNDQISVLREKISTLQVKVDQFESKKKKIIDLYVEGLIDKEERDKRLKKEVEGVKTYKDTILSYNEKIEGFLSLLEGNKENELTPDKLKSLWKSVLEEEDLKTMNEIVKKHIHRVSFCRYWFGKSRAKDSKKENAQLITVELVNGEVQKYVYVPRKYKNCRWWWYFDDGREIPILSIRPINRKGGTSLEKRAFKSIDKW